MIPTMPEAPATAPQPAPGLGARVQAALVALGRWPWLVTLRTLGVRFREDRLGVMAGSLTFTTLISLVPLVTVMLALFTAFPMFGSFQAALEKFLLQNLVPENLARPVLGALTQFAAKASRIGVAGLVLLVASALALMLTIDRTLNAIWRVRRPRPLGRRLLVYWAVLTFGPLVLGASLTLTSYAISASRGLVKALPGGVGTLVDVLQFGLLAGAFALLFRVVPHTHVRWVHAWAGGLFAAVGVEVAKEGLALYVREMPGFSTIYGAFATLPLLLLWVYLLWVVILLGAVVAAYAPTLSSPIARRPDQPGERFTLAVEMLVRLAAARHTDTHGLSARALAAALRADPLRVEPILDLLVDMGWVGRLDEVGEPRHVLLAEPEVTRVGPLVERLLLGRSAATQGLRRHASLDDLTLAQLLD
jgi:membrane protein